ncbi:Tetratricopeptide repeat-containing domain [Macleaya cordata]|uniref:Tetratricopeptide repeat-containing domain n=1 Tax=Macleaya cordata TaxID=56857 RepID=A0A200QP93_MACCD|nr:Tetratricopeptide repeat-containing domain [Macleaya cordata]
MSHSNKHIPEIGFDSLNDRFRSTLICEDNKPDFKELDLGSPVSPLRTARNGVAPTTSSSSSSSGSVSGKTGVNSVVKTSQSHSGELSGSSESSPTVAETVRSASATRNSRPGHVRSHSAGVPLIYSGSSVNSSPTVNALPTGNICPSGKILKTGMAHRSPARSDILGSGTGNYGHGSIMRGGVGGKSGGNEVSGGNLTGKLGSLDPEEVKRAGNEKYKRGHFAEALCLYDRAIAISPENAAYRSNRAAALTGLGRLMEAVRECEEAVRLDPGYFRAHQRLASLHLKLGHVEIARRHLFFQGQQPDPAELQKLQAVERHLNRCFDARKIGDWKSVLRECDGAIAAGAESSPQLFACRAEALLKLHQLDDADSSLEKIPKFEPSPASCSQTKFFGMLSDSYLFFVRAQVEMALGRFEIAASAAEKAGLIDHRNAEVAVVLNNVRSVARARARGNELFNSGKYAEACSAYGEGLKFAPSNSVLYCNRAVCWSKLGNWERSVEDCNQALKIQPNYTKALLRRAVSYGKLERWVESVRDYEVLRKELPGDNEVAEALFHAQVALKKSRGEEVYNMKFGGEVEEISGIDQFRAAISSPGVSIVFFKAVSNQQCEQISPFVDTLCVQYPSVNFLKVDVGESASVANTEAVRIVPTFKIYKNGSRVKEMICPSHQVLEYSVRHYSL